MCRKLQISRQAYYQARRRRQCQKVDEELVVNLVKEQRNDHVRMGARKLQVQIEPGLVEAGVKIGRDRFFRVLRDHGMLVEPRPPEYPTTTNSYHCLPVFENLVRDLPVDRCHQVLVSDLTYLRTEEGFLFLALIMDKMSRKIVGYHCGDSLEATGCVKALDMALAQLPEGAKPIHHSDRGCQYCCHEYVNKLIDRGLRVSMTERDHCAENAMAERLNGILKSEYGLGYKLRSKAMAQVLVHQAIELYNTRRPHMALGYKTPEAVHSLAA